MLLTTFLEKMYGYIAEKEGGNPVASQIVEKSSDYLSVEEFVPKYV